MRFEFIQVEKANFPVTVLCRVLEVSCSGFYRWLNAQPSERQTNNERLMIEIKPIHSESRGTYGSPRVHAELRARGFEIGLNRVARLMAELGLTGLRPRRFRKTTDSHHRHPIAPDLVARDFNPSAPNQLWAADITYIATASGWAYLAVVLDLFSRRVIGWAVDEHMRTELVLEALDRALGTREHSEGLAPLFRCHRARTYPFSRVENDCLRHVSKKSRTLGGTTRTQPGTPPPKFGTPSPARPRTRAHTRFG